MGHFSGENQFSAIHRQKLTFKRWLTLAYAYSNFTNLTPSCDLGGGRDCRENVIMSGFSRSNVAVRRDNNAVGRAREGCHERVVKLGRT